MNFIEASLLILFVATVSVPLANRFRLPLEIFLVFGSCLLGLVSGLIHFQLDPMIVFNLFLPPVLFYAAYFTSWHDFKYNLRPITLLAFGLVIFTTLIVAVISKLLVPGFSWGNCFLLGAIVSPTDATAATTIIKKLGAPRRLITVLEGESLVNDATALLLFRFILTAILFGKFSLLDASLQFVTIAAGGAALGLIIAFIVVFILKLMHNAQAETTLTFITAFTCYMLGETLGVSGVISTVVCGIYLGIHFPEFASTQAKINAKASWNTLMFIVNGFVFTLIGLTLPSILKDLNESSIVNLIFYAILITLVIICARILWVFPMAHLTRFFFPSIARKDPIPPWQGLFLLSWSGMRGIVSLAAALSIPFLLSSGIAFPQRNEMIFLAYSITFLTLVIPTLTLPWLIRHFGLTDDADVKMREEAMARITSIQAAMEKTKNLAESDHIDKHLFKSFYETLERQLKVVQTQLEPTAYSSLTDELVAIKKLNITMIESERVELIKLRHEGKIHDEVFHLLSDELDLEEMRAKSLRI